MNVTYIHHSCFLVETDRFYYLFDYAEGQLPAMDATKPVFVLASHGHADHYHPDVFPLLKELGMEQIRAVLSEDIAPPAGINALRVFPGEKYDLGDQQTLTAFRSTDLGVAFLIEDRQTLIYHAGDLNDWVWDEESDAYNQEMTENYRRQIDLLSETLDHRGIDAAFVVLDPRQEKDYDRGMLYFLEKISANRIFPMHYWGNLSIMDTFLREHPEYGSRIQRTE